MSKEVKNPAEKKNETKGFFRDNTEEVEINGRKILVFAQEAKVLRAKLAKKAKAEK